MYKCKNRIEIWKYLLVFVSGYRSDEEWHENDAKELDAEKNSRWYDEEIDRVLFDLVEDERGTALSGRRLYTAVVLRLYVQVAARVRTAAGE